MNSQPTRKERLSAWLETLTQRTRQAVLLEALERKKAKKPKFKMKSLDRIEKILTNKEGTNK